MNVAAPKNTVSKRKLPKNGKQVMRRFLVWLHSETPAAISIFFLTALTITAIFASVFAPYDPLEQDLTAIRRIYSQPELNRVFDNKPPSRNFSANPRNNDNRLNAWYSIGNDCR